MSPPLISIVIPTKNSLPHLKNAIEGLRHQTYRTFELIIQDGGSTDGTLEYLSSVRDFFKIDIQSQPDSGIGQAYNRGIARSNGDYLFLAASDERLFDHTLEKLLSWFCEHPSAAVIYGAVSLIDCLGNELSNFVPQPFDLQKFMRCELFHSTAGLLNRKVIGLDLFYDESLKTCPDYDFWLRLGIRFSAEELICKEEVLMASLADRTSMSYRAESFQQFCKDKQFILHRFLDRASHVLKNLGDLEKECLQAKAGILTWAAKEVMNIAGLSPYTQNLYQEAAALLNTVNSPPIGVQTLPIAFIVLSAVPITKNISGVTLLLKNIKKYLYGQNLGRWEGGKDSWGYIAQARARETVPLDKNSNYWVKIRMRVFSGVVGICYMNENELKQERYFSNDSEDVLTYYPIHDLEKFSMIFRNGGVKQSNFEIYELSVVQANPARG